MWFSGNNKSLETIWHWRWLLIKSRATTDRWGFYKHLNITLSSSLLICRFSFFCFFACFAECVPLTSTSVWKLACRLSVTLLLFSSLLFSQCTHFFLSHSLELEAPLCACGLFTRNTDSPSEVWLARTGRGRNMNEFTAPQPSTSTLYSQILPSSFFLSTCSSATSSHTFPLVCACVSESVFV